MTFVLLFAVLLLALAGCSKGEPRIRVEEQEALLSPIILGSGSIFMKIVNSGTGGDSLIKARINIPDAVVELHDYQEGKMATINRIPIQKKSTTVLRPASYHIMIFRMPKDLAEGAEVIVTLVFETSGEISLPLQFKSSATHQRKGSYR